MKTKPNHIVGSGLFSIMALFFMFVSQISYSQTSGVPITSSTTWTAPAGVTSVTVECWGAGGGGSGGNIKNLGNGGGGGGAYATAVIIVIPGNQYTVTVGTGGAAGTNGSGNAGGNSSFNITSVIAIGGSGGTTAQGTTPGSGGPGGLSSNCTPTLNAFSGGNGGNGDTNSNGGGGGGSADNSSNGGNGGTPTAGTAPSNGGIGGLGGTNSIGLPGTAPGGGGGGAGDKNNGGAGADGQVILTWSAVTTPTTLTISNPSTPVTTATACASSVNVPIHAVNISADGSTGTGTLTNFQIVTSEDYAVSDIDNFKIWYNSTDNLGSATLVSTKTPVTIAGTQTFPAFSVDIPAGTTYYFWVTMDVASSAVIGRTLTVNGSASTDMTTALIKAGGPTTASGAQTLSAIPAAPTANAGSGAANTQITANWSASAGATSYRLDVATVNTFATFVAGYQNLDVTNVTTYDVTGLTAETTYYYRIRAVNICGTSGNSNTITYATTAAAGPPTTLTISNPSTPVTTATACASDAKVPIHAVNISADGSSGTGTLTNVQIVTTGTYAVSDITNFEIWYNSTNDLASATLLSTKTPVTIAGPQTFPAFSVDIPAGTTYYFWVTMDVASGVVIGKTITVSGSAASDMTTTLIKAGGPTTASGAQTLTDVPAAPIANPGSGATGNQITANWSASIGATSYRLDVSTVNTFASFVAGYQDLNVGNVTTYDVTGLTAETTYYYRIRAVNICDTSGNSGTITYATTVAASQPPTITFPDSNPLAVQGGSATNLIYIATTNSPDQYSVVYDAAALGEGFVNVTLALLPPSPIELAVPDSPPPALGNYNGILTVRNSTSGLTSVNYPIIITISDVTDHSLYNCTSCHITHNAPGTTLTNVDGNALLCQSCHITNGAASNRPLVDANNIALFPSTGNSHAWNVSAVNVSKETLLPLDPGMSLRTPLVNEVPGTEQIICSTCHNPHNNGALGSPYLRLDNTNNDLCKDCHRPRDVGIYSDAPLTNKGSHPVGVIYDDTDTRFKNTQTLIANGNMVQCSTCHGVHDVDGSLGLVNNGNLLKMTNDVNLCKDCHAYETHNTMDCLDCHQVHNTDKSNLYMIKSNITVTTPAPANASINADVVFTSLTGANNFADGDGVDGVCEVCHTTTSHFRNAANLAGAPDQLHTSQGLNISDQNCTTCHQHSNNFAGGDCVTCHQDNTTYPYLTGNWNISDAHVVHNTRYGYDCSTCHFGYGSGGASESTHPSGTINVDFDPNGMATRNGLDGNTPDSWTGTTCGNIYCHSNGMTADRGTDINDLVVNNHNWGDGTTTPTIPYINHDPLTYATTPNWDTGSITACTSCHGGPAALPAGPSYDVAPSTPQEVRALTTDYPQTGGHGSFVSQHLSNSNISGWAAVQCFWCHDTDSRLGTDLVKKQGTYGTPNHVDGQTHFKVGNIGVDVDGTFETTLVRGSIGGHCNSKSCWGTN